MGILISLLQSVVDFFRGSPQDKYKQVDTTDTVDTKTSAEDNSKTVEIKYAEKPKLHKACRSSNEHRLTSYQSRIDNLKITEVVYVSILLINRLLF